MKLIPRLLTMNTEIKKQILDVKLRVQAGIALHRTLINNASIPSCLNCDWYEPSNEYCKKFKSNPPAETIVFSCGIENWVPEIPF